MAAVPRGRVSRGVANERQVGGKHYKANAIEPWDFIHRNRLGFLEGEAIKHVARHREKKGREDIEKAIHYLEKLLEEDYSDDHQVTVKD